MKVLIAGAHGLVGNALVEHCKLMGDEVLAHPRQTLDIVDLDLVTKTINEARPDIVINCAAWTDVDGCESDSERAFQVNARGPENLARACQKNAAAFVTISTDYVFDGKKEGFYTQLDEPNPISVYGVSKLEGEQRARNANPQTIVARTGFVFGDGGRNFLSTVVARARRGEVLQAIADARGTPTFAPDLAARLRELAVRKDAGLFHVVNSGTGASYEEFVRLALEIAGLEQTEVMPVTVKSLRRPAPRPTNSCLRCLASESLGLGPMQNWKDALRRFVAQESEKASSPGTIVTAQHPGG
ncbi:MAG: dTDP-4-dehydrorhamnose reductase [Acidobacteriota bacterium]|nr:dTDP-4-dehydrorhamnose reductase [Acidobacteriota bacterium]